MKRQILQISRCVLMRLGLLLHWLARECKRTRIWLRTNAVLVFVVAYFTSPPRLPSLLKVLCALSAALLYVVLIDWWGRYFDVRAVGRTRYILSECVYGCIWAVLVSAVVNGYAHVLGSAAIPTGVLGWAGTLLLRHYARRVT